ncbi:ATP-binding protein [Kitasatospora sp. NPDC002551]|uniref:ATP-binding protein n=1 Tax=Kitasatospora sp. NPDC002551 TaxID=3154539 RepID=UPI00331762B5
MTSKDARKWGVPLSAEALGEVELCAGELITNAIEHAGERCTVTVRWACGLLRIEVADRCPSLRLRETDPDATGGRGLLLVEALAFGWGWERSGPGKIVWLTYAPDLQLPVHGWGSAPDLHRIGRVA